MEGGGRGGDKKGDAGMKGALATRLAGSADLYKVRGQETGGLGEGGGGMKKGDAGHKAGRVGRPVQGAKSRKGRIRGGEVREVGSTERNALQG